LIPYFYQGYLLDLRKINVIRPILANYEGNYSHHIDL
jgi:hypothetical protein